VGSGFQIALDRVFFPQKALSPGAVGLAHEASKPNKTLLENCNQSDRRNTP
jgi:hypothetical protein